jgi:hypothetical protein
MENQLSAILEKAQAILAKAGPEGASKRKLLFWANLVESFKMVMVIQEQVTPPVEERLLSAEPAEVLCRALLERAIVVQYFGRLVGEEAPNRFWKTYESSISKKWPGETTIVPDPNHQELPSYRQMAEHVDQSGELYRAYCQLSHVAHPRSCVPYIVSQNTFVGKNGGSNLDFFHRRTDDIINATCISLRVITEVCEKELTEKA